MDVKEKLQNISASLEVQQFDKKLIITLGISGIAIMIFAIWLGMGDRSSSEDMSLAEAEWQQSLDQLSKPVQALNRALFDDQVQALTARAIENPDTLDDLISYLNGRIGDITGAQVFGSDLRSLEPGEIGPNGYAVFDMLLTMQENRFPQLQFHHSMEPLILADAIKIGSGDELLGYLVVYLKPEFILSHFKPEYSELGYIGLSQYNGRQQSNMLLEFGDATLVNEVPDRQTVPGTRFRVEYPMQYPVTVLDRGLFMLMMLVGGALVAIAVFLGKINKKLSKAKPRKMPEVAKLPAATEPIAGPADHDFETEAPAIEEPLPQPS